MANGKQGRLYLVGAGPGDPELITRKAHRLLQEAQLILHDDLVSPGVLALAGPQAEIINVGKRCGAKRITQAEINALMIDAARRGLDVVRLKSGDPAIFGRLGEEIDALQQAGIGYEIVPGITAGFAAATAMGMSLTDRRTASRLLIASAHHAADDAQSDRPQKDAPPESAKESPDWSGLQRGDTTLMIYMPGHGLAGLRDELLAAGLAADTPAIIVSRASTPQQRYHETTLAGIAAGPQLDAPSVLLIGRALDRNRRQAFSTAAAPSEVSLLLGDAEALLADE